MTHQSEVNRRQAVERNRWVRYTVEAYTQPQQFKTPAEYLAALTECLDNLAQAAGQEPPERHDVWSNA